ncbi:MAG TPA: hypothetical protein VHX42_04035 [Candidatus Babeliales bacterium]|jgi:hypothetical protein|nr:hypothetical protein [Candidatus Babeliales bacterium]
MTIKSLFLFSFITVCIGSNIIAQQGILFSQLDSLTQEQYRKMIKKYDEGNKDCNWTLFLKYNNDGKYNFIGFGDVLIRDASEQDLNSVKDLQDIEKAMDEDNIVVCSYWGYTTMICNTKDNSSCESEIVKTIATRSYQMREEIALEHAVWDSIHERNKNRNPLTKIFHKIFG